MIVEGINVVNELLNSNSKIEKILLENSNNLNLQKILEKAKNSNVKCELLSKQDLDKIRPNSQGVLAFVPAYKFAEIEDILSYAQSKNQNPFIVILDGIMDPHNLGAIIRTCECAGVHGVIIPENRACDVTDTVYKTSAGAVCHIKIAKVVNLTRTIEKLKKLGVWIYALEAGNKRIYKADFTYPTALVIGGEGKGVSRLVKENVDEILSLDMFGKVNSLNASNAATIAIYEVLRQRVK